MIQNNSVLIDFHSHILPKCDHGSDSVTTSIKQLQLAQEAGIKLVCATPHFYPDKTNIKDFLLRRKVCYNKLMGDIAQIYTKCSDLNTKPSNDIHKRNKHSSFPKVLLGAEVLICENIDKMENLHSLCLEGTDYLLLEMPFYKWSDEIFDTVDRLAFRDDLKIVVAHADRYNHRDVEILLEMGLKLQINADSLSSVFKNRHLLKWLDNGQVVALGSDIHGTNTGYKHFIKCCRKYGDRLNCCNII